MRDPIHLLLSQLHDVAETMKVIAASENQSAKLDSVVANFAELAEALNRLKFQIFEVIKDPKKVPATSEVLLDDVETQKYTGAFWRKPTLEELDALATYMAEDVLRYNDICDVDLSDPDVFHFNYDDEKALAFEEIKEMAMVVELPSLEWKIFYKSSLAIDKSHHSNAIHLHHSINSYLQEADGSFTCIDLTDYLDIY